MAKVPSTGTLPTASVRETLAIFRDILVPTLAKGAIIRRPKVVGMSERLGLDGRAVRRLQQLSDTHGSGPLLVRTPYKTLALVLDPAHVHRVLEDTPEPFTPDESAKRSALSHFEPEVALISRGSERTERRQYNEKVLDMAHAVHRMAERFLPVVDQEAQTLLDAVQRQGGTLDWDMFIEAWFRVVRRVVLGDAARDDHELTDLLADLRAAGNWGFARPKRDQLNERFFARLHAHLERAEPGSLAAAMARTPANGKTAPENQVPQWLFAFDPAGMATFRALGLLAAHRGHAERARAEIAEHKAEPQPELNFLRACVLESLRLWPTTPMMLRESTQPTHWEAGAMPARTSILIFTPYFHRDDRHLDYADRFAPELWLTPRDAGDWPLIPFSGGPGVCPGRHLVLMLTSRMLARLIEHREVRLEPPERLDEHRPMPALLDNYTLRFQLDERPTLPPR
ncbi:cytochrome P450 [Halomonas shantousis]